MSRWYQLKVTPVSSTGEVSKTPSSWTSRDSSGKAIMSAQTIEFDLTVTTGAVPSGGSFIRIWGPSKEQIQQASDFNMANIELYGGMQKGLPLATRAVEQHQAGLLAKGVVIQAFGNWQGITQTLDFVIVAGEEATPLQSDPSRQAADAGAPPPPQNFGFNWKQGSTLTDNITSVLEQAYPSADVKVNATDSGLVLLHDEAGVFTDLRTFSTYVQGLSRDLKGPAYRGLDIIGDSNGGFTVFDNTQPADNVVNITMLDLVGNVTWLDSAIIQFSTILRADLSIGSIVTFPPLAQAQAVTTSSSNSNARVKNTFDGKWQINNFVRHVGNSRAPDAQSWVSTFQAVPLEPET